MLSMILANKNTEIGSLDYEFELSLIKDILIEFINKNENYSLKSDDFTICFEIKELFKRHLTSWYKHVIIRMLEKKGKTKMVEDLSINPSYTRPLREEIIAKFNSFERSNQEREAKPAKPVLKYDEITLDQVIYSHRSQNRRYGSAFEIYTLYSEFDIKTQDLVVEAMNIDITGTSACIKKSKLNFKNNKSVYKYLIELERFIDWRKVNSND